LTGAAGIIATHPLDTIKSRLQTQGSSGYHVLYRGPLHCGVTVIKSEGVRALYKGLTMPVVSMAGLNAVLFGTYSKCIQYIEPNGGANIKSMFIATIVASIAQSPLSSSIDLFKLRLQVENIGGYYHSRFSSHKANNVIRGPIQLIHKILQTEGLKGIFKGLQTTIVRDCIGFCGYFMPYEYMCRYMAGDHRSVNDLSSFHFAVAGGIAGVLTWSICYPVDVVKSRIQVDGVVGPPQYNGMIDCFKKSYRSEGWKVFCRGLGVTAFRAFPANAVTFSVVTLLLKLMREQDNQAIL
jgi:solute carrier family 25 carnitine/acylcarnitine transporter 20/29